MPTYIVLAGGKENDMPDGYRNEVVVYLGSISTDREFPIDEIPELLYKVEQQNEHNLEAREIKSTVENAEYIRILEVSADHRLSSKAVNLNNEDENDTKDN